MTAPRPSILSSWSDHCLRVRCCPVMRLVLWQEVQAAFTLAGMGPGGSRLPGALGACAVARMMDANRKIAGKTRWNKQYPFLSSQNWMWFVFCGRYFFALVCEVIGSRFLELRKAGASGAKWSIMRITNTPF